MLTATRQWLRRNRTPIAIGAGVIGAGYVATQYVLGKINDARERMSSDRIAKENLRRRFEQNQEDCTFTVLALLPTATANILESMNTEKITLEIQQMKGAKGPRSGDPSGAPPSIADTTMTEDESRSNFSGQSESMIHASVTSIPGSTIGAENDRDQDGTFVAARLPLRGTPPSTAPAPTAVPAAAAAPAPTPSAATLAPPSSQKKKSKRQLWDDLTISSITRAFTLIYTLALLTMLTRLQLNLLGRRSYLSSVVSLATGPSHSTISLENNDDDNVEQVYGSDFEVNRKYLTFSWWLLNRGYIDIRERVEEAVKEVFGHLSPRDLLSFDNFAQLTIEVRKKIEGGPSFGDRNPGSRWLRFLLPPQTLEDYVLRESGVLGDSATADTQTGSPRSSSPPASPSAPLRRIVDETSDLIESPSFHHVLGLLLDAAFSVLLHEKVLPGAFAESGPTPMIPEFQLQSSSTVVLLPKILSVLTRQAHSIGSGMPAASNEYLQAMESVRDLEAFAAVVYSSNWENEIAAGESEGADERSFSAAPAPNSTAAGAATASSSGIEESIVMVEHPALAASSFESAWEKAEASAKR
ncbi:Peroxin-3 [Microdochium bolleyi]|uniref:Peroxin-3 n=1 Tax=Microdochium bolleyi TaxID=196109 RepID=A0A136JAR6_9PEZI|nr:Peroxin-3 [Microdochium bolleyi]